MTVLSKRSFFILSIYSPYYTVYIVRVLSDTFILHMFYVTVNKYIKDYVILYASTLYHLMLLFFIVHKFLTYATGVGLATRKGNFFYSDFRYRSQAEAQVTKMGFEFVEVSKDSLKFVGEHGLCGLPKPLRW